MLHEGSVAHNLDPFGTCGEAALADAIVRARLPAEMLHATVAKGGANLSSGERQLVRAARPDRAR